MGEKEIERQTHPSSSLASEDVYLHVPGPLPAPRVLRMVMGSADYVAGIILPSAARV